MTVAWKAFELRPPGANVPPKPEAYMQRAWEGVRQLCRQFGLPEMRRNSRRDLSSRLALAGQKFAAAHGRSDEYTTAVFQAMFYDDQDISDLNVLAERAAGAGLDPAAFRNALAGGRYTAAVEADVDLAAAWGITAIPCFVSGNRGLMGVQTYDSLVGLVTGQEARIELEDA